MYLKDDDILALFFARSEEAIACLSAKYGRLCGKLAMNILGYLRDAEECVNDVYNIGGEDLSLKEMADMVAAKYGVKVIPVPWPELALKIESGDTVFDSSKLEKIIGRRTCSTFSERLKDL